MKKLHIILVFIIILVLIPIIIVRFPVKNAIKISFENTEQQQINEKDTRIICRYTSYTGPQWQVIGKEEKLFTISTECESVILKGNAPKNLNGDIFYSPSDNIFVFDGKIVGDEIGDDKGKYKAFEVKKWNIVYPVDRGSGFVELMPSSALTPYDFIPLDK